MSFKINRRSVLTGATGLAFLSGVSPVFAHRLTTTETRVDIKRETGRIEVVHTLHVHDTEIALFKAGIIDSPDLVALRQRAQLALYVGDTFKMYQNEKPLDLTLLGAELDKRNVVVFQEGKIDLPMGDLSVSAAMMRDMVHNQINNVDVYIDGKVSSLQFRGADSLKKVLA